MRKLTKKDEAEVVKAATEYILTKARDAENGSWHALRFDAPWDGAFGRYNVAILHDIVVAGDGAGTWRIHRRWSSKKKNGCYPQLKPTLERFDISVDELEAMLLEKGASQRSVDRALGRPMRSAA